MEPYQVNEAVMAAAAPGPPSLHCLRIAAKR
jgi:ornithine carbamoyltransferase